MDENQKLSVSLRQSLAADPTERAAGDDLSTGSFADGTWELIVLYSGAPASLAAAFPNAVFTFLLINYAIVRISEDDLTALSSNPQIIYVERPHRLYFETENARRSSCLSAVQESQNTALTGKGVLLAVIDSGIDYTHPDFRNADGSTRIAALWDQTVAAANSGRFPPEHYPLGTLYDSAAINDALSANTAAERLERCSSVDISGHGTHVAGIAAGNGRADSRFRGVAYEASLLIVKLGSPASNGFPNTVELMQAVDFSVRYALERDLPLSVNISFGNTYGSHSGTSLLETYLDRISSIGRISIAVGSGNEGTGAGHARITLTGASRIELSVGDYEPSLSIQLWKNYWDEVRFRLVPPFGSASFELPDQPGSSRFSSGETDLLVYYGEPSPYSIYQEISVELLPKKDFIDAGVWQIGVTAQSASEGALDLWLPSAAARGSSTQFLTPEPDTTLTLPSTAGSVITVGAYDSAADTFASFSGRGYTWSTRQVKPELLAPGVDITSCAVGGGYESRSGTSMATPFVSGSAALLLQWGILEGNDLFLYGEKLKAYLIRGARRPPFAASVPNPQSGYGTLCVRDSFPF